MQPCPRQEHATMVSQTTHHSVWREDRTCSYCGSISPDYLFEALGQDCVVGPTDKNYKMYIDLIEPNPGEMKIVGVTTSEHPSGTGWVPGDSKFLSKHGWKGQDYKWMKLIPKGATKFGKFYFYHLDEKEQDHFIDLMNQKKLKIGPPGHFYVLPFFMRTQPR